MSNSTIDSVNGSTPETAATPTKAKGALGAKKAKAAKKARWAKKPAGKLKAERTNKKGEVVTMKRAKGSTLPEIMEATGWQPHSVR